MLWRDTRNVILTFDLECMVTFYKSILNKTYIYILINSLVRWDLFCRLMTENILILHLVISPISQFFRLYPPIFFFLFFSIFKKNISAISSFCESLTFITVISNMQFCLCSSHFVPFFTTLSLLLQGWDVCVRACVCLHLWGCFMNFWRWCVRCVCMCVFVSFAVNVSLSACLLPAYWSWVFCVWEPC